MESPFIFGELKLRRVNCFLKAILVCESLAFKPVDFPLHHTPYRVDVSVGGKTDRKPSTLPLPPEIVFKDSGRNQIRSQLSRRLYKKFP